MAILSTPAPLVPRRSWAVVAALGFLVATGCARELSMQAASYQPRRARIVFMPAMVALYTLSSEGQMVGSRADGQPALAIDAHLVFQEERSKTVRQTVDKWLKTYVEEHDSRIAELDEVAQTRLPSNVFYNVMNEVTKAIVVDWLDHSWSPQPLSHWRAEPRFEGWESALEADYVVFVKFVGSYETSDLQASNSLHQLFGGATVTARRVAILAVVDVNSGRIVCLRGDKFDELWPDQIEAHLKKLVQPLAGY